MSKEAVFTMKLEPELRREFFAAAEAADRPASHVVRELMRDFIRQQKEAREYEGFLYRKVDHARAQVRSGESSADEDVEAEFSDLRDGLLRIGRPVA